MPSLHFNSQVSSLHKIDQRDQSSVVVRAFGGSNPNAAFVAKGWRTHHAPALNNIRSHHRRLNFERVAWHPMRMLLARTPHPLTFHKVFGHALANMQSHVEKR
jgi:hypothetical protein